MEIKKVIDDQFDYSDLFDIRKKIADDPEGKEEVLLQNDTLIVFESNLFISASSFLLFLCLQERKMSVLRCQ